MSIGELQSRKAELEDMLATNGERLGDCDCCHRRGALVEDLSHPGGFEYCLSCLGRKIANITKRIDELSDYRPPCPVCGELHPWSTEGQQHCQRRMSGQGNYCPSFT